MREGAIEYALEISRGDEDDKREEERDGEGEEEGEGEGEREREGEGEEEEDERGNSRERRGDCRGDWCGDDLIVSDIEFGKFRGESEIEFG